MSLLLTIATPTQAQECCDAPLCCNDEKNFYAKVLGGANFLHGTTINGNKSTYHPGYVVDGSLGFCWSRYGLNLEAEYAFRKNGINEINFITQGSSNEGHFFTSSYMVNLLWDMGLCWQRCSFWNIRPFVGTGLGYDFQQMHATNSLVDFYQKWHHLSWQAMAGFAYPICHNTDMTLEYKFHQGSSFCNHAIGVGIAYKFGFMK